MLIDIVFVIVGAALVLYGADRLTDGGVALARRFGISEMVIGLTILAFGTSLPEFIVSFLASLDGTPAMGVGNVLGSNIFNTLMIVGVTSMVAPIAVRKSTVYKDIPFSLLASIVLAALAMDGVFGDVSLPDTLSRGDGVALLGFFAVFMAYTFAIARDTGPTATDDPDAAPVVSVGRATLYIVLGLVGLIVGGEVFVSSAAEIARELGVSEAVIGLTLVAGGTSLPELATSVIAARKGSSGLAIGNVIGSNLFNIFWILGLCSVVTPMPTLGITGVDFAMLVVSGILFWIFSRTSLRIERWEGTLLVIAYAAYLAWLLTGV